MKQRRLIGSLVLIGVLALVALLLSAMQPQAGIVSDEMSTITLSGVYECLPRKDNRPDAECVFGMKTDGGYYAVNIGASAESMRQFQEGYAVQAEGFVVPTEALSTDRWHVYNMRGIFTVTKVLRAEPPTEDVDVRAMCESALIYMTFPDGAAANAFITDCMYGKHPEVIDRYLEEHGLLRSV